MKAHFDNDTWTKRTSPPPDWSKPLPAFMEERNKNSYLAIKNEELKAQEEQAKRDAAAIAAGEKVQVSEPKSSFCTFM